jgi:hypothetical protein
MGRKLGRQLGRIEDPLEFGRQRTKNRRWGELVSAAEPIVWICSARDKVRNIRNIGRMLGSPQNPPSSSWNPAFERLSTCVSTARRLQAGRLLTEGLEQSDAVTERAGRILFDAASGKVRIEMIKPPDGSARDEAEAIGQPAAPGRRKSGPRHR